jgi:hypothetical protein
MRFTMGNVTVRLGKSPHPTADDRDPLSRIARAYGVRRDMFEVREAIGKRLNLPADHATANVVGQMVASLINAELTNPGTLDRVVAGRPLPSWARHLAVGGNVDVPSISLPDQTVELVLANIRVVVGGAESQNRPG